MGLVCRGGEGGEREVSGAAGRTKQGVAHGLPHTHGEVPLERLVDGDAVHVGVVDEPNDLVGEELPVVGGGQVRLGRLGGVQLQRLAHPLPQHVQRGVGFHDLRHRLLQQRFGPGEPVAVPRVEVVREVHRQQRARGGGVDGHVVGGVVEELGPRVPLNVVRVKVAPPQLHVQPKLGGGDRAVVRVPRVVQQRRPRHTPLVRGKEQDVRAGGVHLVRLARVDRLLLHRLHLERVQLLVKHLAHIHDDRLVDLLPQVRAENLDQGDFQGGQLAVHENARQVELHLEPDVHVGAVDGGGPPQREPAVGDLVQTHALRVGEPLELHRLLEPWGWGGWG